MASITSIEELIDEFSSVPLEEKPQVLERIEIPSEELEEYASWEDGDYTRNCLWRCDEFEIILLCWDEQAETKIHDHGGQDCWIYQVEGDLLEKRYKEDSRDNLKLEEKLRIKEGELSYMNDKMGYHSIKNDSDDRALTLHFYATPIDRCRIYSPEKSKFEMTELVYSSLCQVGVSSN